jgi:bifunctional enzyme CysN/CysC
VAYSYFSTHKRKFIIADTPGHEQYTRNMATGASTADLALILIDASQGVLIQSKRHAFIASLLGIPHILIAINKMDLVDYSEKVFNRIKADFSRFAAKLNVNDIHFIPVSALKGDNVVERSENMNWYNGTTVLTYLEDLYITSDRNLVDLRMPVQYVLRPDSSFRGYCTRIASGTVKKNDEVVILPSKKTTRIKSIVSFDGDLEQAYNPMSVTVTLEDEIDISRGDMIVHKHNVPTIGRHFETMLIWMDEKVMSPGNTYILKHTTHTCKVLIDGIRYKVNVSSLGKQGTEKLELNEIGRVVMTANQALYFDSYARNRNTGNFILIDPITNSTAAAGMIIERKSIDPVVSELKQTTHDTRQEAKSLISVAQRKQAMKQLPKTLWLTGLHASGKTSIAYELEKELFKRGKMTVVLTGTALRSGMSRTLDFDLTDRIEHLRRAAETAYLLNQHGIIVICAFISPDKSVRSHLKDIIGKDEFIEIHVDSPIEQCRRNDRSGLYEKAEKGLINDLAGVSFPYESPEKPDIYLDMQNMTSDNAVKLIVQFLSDNGVIF